MLVILARSRPLECDFIFFVPSWMQNVPRVLAPNLFLDLVDLAGAIPYVLGTFCPCFFLYFSERISSSSVLLATGPTDFTWTEPVSYILRSPASIAFGLSIELAHLEGDSFGLRYVSAFLASELVVGFLQVNGILDGAFFHSFPGIF